MCAILDFILIIRFLIIISSFFIQKKVYPIKDTPEYLNFFDYLSNLNNQISRNTPEIVWFCNFQYILSFIIFF